jgi:molybdate transport system ATP-binding protein
VSAAASGEGGGPGLTVRLRQARPIPLDVELACAPGELLALVGPSGSGKSTTLRAIAGLYRVGDGLVRCGGRTWLDTGTGVDLPAYRRSVGLVFQSYALFPHMTALGNVVAAMGHRPAAGRVARARGLLAQVRLAGLEDRRPAELSGGQQQRVAVARALAREPSALLLDEPFSAVDRSTRERLYRELVELRRGFSIPVVLVTHDLGEAALLADRMSLLHHGRTLQTATPHELTTRPVSAEVARLVGLRNLYTGRVVEHVPERGVTLLAWRDRVLEAAMAPGFGPGEPVAWAIPETDVLMHRRDRPSRGERENPVPAVVAELWRLGQNLTARLQADGNADEPLFLTIPVHVARRNGVEVGVTVTVSLLADAIHLMPAEGRGGAWDRASLQPAQPRCEFADKP